MKRSCKAGWLILGGLAIGTSLTGWTGCAAAQAADVQAVSLAPHESASGPGGTTLVLDELTDSRCRAAEHCRPADAASRDAAVQVTMRMPDGQRYAATLAIGGAPGRASLSAPAYAKLGNLLVELAGIAPQGRELPADGPSRVQRATLRMTPAERVAAAAGAAVQLARAGFELKVLSIDDRRCPRDVMCASAGYVQIDVELSAKGAPAERVTFGSPTVARQMHAWKGYEIELCDVLPRRTLPTKEAASMPLQAEFFVSPRPVAPGAKSAVQAPRRPTCVPPMPEAALMPQPLR